MTSDEKKAVIVKAITDTLRNRKQETRRPSIDELEKMLNSDEQREVNILPDGSITVELPVYASDLADAILAELVASPESEG